jgi:hypothetical protein
VAALHDMDRHPGKEEAGFSWHGTLLDNKPIGRYHRKVKN